MWSSFPSDYWLEKSNFTPTRWERVLARKKCSWKLCVHRKTFKSLRSSEYHCPEIETTCQVHNVFFENQRTSFFSCDQKIWIFEEMLKTNKDIDWDVFCPASYFIGYKYGYIQTWRRTIKDAANGQNVTRALKFWFFLLGSKRQPWIYLPELAYIFFIEKRFATTEKRNQVILEKLFHQSQLQPMFVRIG